MQLISKGYGFVIFLLFAFVSVLYLGYCTAWVFVPWLDQFMFDTGIAFFWIVGFLTFGAVLWLISANTGRIEKQGRGLLLFQLSFIGTITTLTMGPIVVFVISFLLFLHMLATCAGQHWIKLELPQYQKTLYQRPRSCWDGVQTGREIYVGKDGHLLLQPLFISESGDPKTFDLAIDDDVVRIAGRSGGSGEEGFRTTIYYNLKTEEIEEFPLKRKLKSYDTEF